MHVVDKECFERGRSLYTEYHRDSEFYSEFLVNAMWDKIVENTLRCSLTDATTDVPLAQLSRAIDIQRSLYPCQISSQREQRRFLSLSWTSPK